MRGTISIPWDEATIEQKMAAWERISRQIRAARAERERVAAERRVLEMNEADQWL